MTGKSAISVEPLIQESGGNYLTFAATSCSTRARCSSLPWKTGVLYPGMFLTRFKGSLLLSPSLGADSTAVEATGVDMVQVLVADSRDDRNDDER